MPFKLATSQRRTFIFTFGKNANETRRRADFSKEFHMVGIVQLAEHRIVVPGVVGSSPITHPRKEEETFWSPLLFSQDEWVSRNEM